MHATPATRGALVGRTVLGVVALAITLALGAGGAAAETATEAGIATETTCSMAQLPAPTSGDAWASTREQPGEPH